MIFLVGNKTQIWLPIFTIHDSNYSSGIYPFLLAIELVLSVIALMLSLRTAYVIYRSGAFHKNMNGLMVYILCSWIESSISKCFLVPYYTGYWTVGDINFTIVSFWTDNVQEMPKIDEFRQASLLFLGGYIHWHYLISAVSCLLILAAERTFASYFLSDYETKPRSYILFSLVLIHQFISIMLISFMFFNILTFIPAVGICIFINMAALSAFIFNRYYNLRLTQQLGDLTNLTQYSLAARFQVKENNRSHELTLRLYTSAFIIVFFAIFIVTLSVAKLLPAWNTFLVFLFESLVHLVPFIVCPVLLFSVSAWSKEVFKPITKNNKPRKSIEMIPKTQPQQQTEVYFSQLHSAWQ